MFLSISYIFLIHATSPNKNLHFRMFLSIFFIILTHTTSPSKNWHFGTFLSISFIFQTHPTSPSKNWQFEMFHSVSWLFLTHWTSPCKNDILGCFSVFPSYIWIMQPWGDYFLELPELPERPERFDKVLVAQKIVPEIKYMQEMWFQSSDEFYFAKFDRPTGDSRPDIWLHFYNIWQKLKIDLTLLPEQLQTSMSSRKKALELATNLEATSGTLLAPVSWHVGVTNS